MSRGRTIERALAIAFILVVSFTYRIASAQLYLPGVGSDLTIFSEPQNPGPGQAVTLTVQSTLLDLTKADITWSVNGKQVLAGVGERQLQTTTGGLGETLSVTASASLNGEKASANAALTPESVDLLFDARSYTPPFYKGRSLPSASTPLRMQAIPHIRTPSGEIAASALTYTWHQDGTVLGSLSGRGRSTAELPAPALFGSTLVEVNAATADGAYSASASVSIPAIDPGITLYQDHPLFGIELYNALADRASVPDLEATFAPVPYYAAAAPDDRSLIYAWSANGKPIPSTSSSNEITINADGITGPASLSLSLTSSADFYLNAQHSWTIVFGQHANAFTAPAAAPAAPADAFHTPYQP